MTALRPRGTTVIPHAHLSLRDIEIAAQALNVHQRAVFLRQQYEDWSQAYSDYSCRYPLEDASDFILMVVAIRRLQQRVQEHSHT
jgi:hypothetical protein